MINKKIDSLETLYHEAKSYIEKLNEYEEKPVGTNELFSTEQIDTDSEDECNAVQQNAKNKQNDKRPENREERANSDWRSRDKIRKFDVRSERPRSRSYESNNSQKNRQGQNEQYDRYPRNNSIKRYERGRSSSRPRNFDNKNYENRNYGNKNYRWEQLEQ